MIATSGGWSLWVYQTTDTIATVDTSGYFTGDAVNMLQANDVVLVIDSTTPAITMTYVGSNDGTTVDMVTGTTISSTDTD